MTYWPMYSKGLKVYIQVSWKITRW